MAAAARTTRWGRRVLAWLGSGFAWGGVGWCLGLRPLGELVLGGVIAAPFIGILIGACFRWMQRRGILTRALGSLLSLYLAAVLFGLGVGLWDAARGIENRDPVGVVLQAVPAVLWGITFTGYVLFLWPLAFWNHKLLEWVERAEER